MADRSLESQLVVLASEIDWPQADLVDRLRLQLTRPRRTPFRARWAWALAGLLVLALLLPPARRVVANMLEVAGIRIEFGQPIDLPAPTDLTPGERSSLEHAQQTVDFPILYPGAVGPPGAVHLVDGELGVQVFLSWEASDRLPEVGDSGIGLLIAQFRASLDEDFIKILFEGTQVDEVRVDGHRAFWLSGAPHVFMFERTSPPGPVADGTRLTGNVLIWEADGVTYRIESGLDLDTTLAIASSLVPAQPG